MTAPAAIHELVERFELHRKEYQQHKNETELRREFLDPFFEALGWDVFNRKSYSERYKEVMHESSVEVEGQAKAADYAFRLGDRIIFFVEAKKPSVNLETNPGPAFQIRRYGWSAKLPINLLTDFEQLAVYDCRAKPDKSDKVSLGRVKLYHFSEYVEKWDEIAGLFGREAVQQGALEHFIESQKGKKGTTEVDDAFLEEIECWRDLLARNLALRNASLNVRELNYAVQMTIDRIIFLRICEDRGIEPDEQLKEIATPAPSPHRPAATSPSPHRPAATSPKSDWGSPYLGEAGRGSIYARLVELFKRADTKYNSGLFHFAADTLTPALQIDDKVLKDILQNLYYPESPYVFNYISADILGQVYERFLGKVIRLTAGHQAKVEEKPEVRKAGGVYYTPTYIVDYIVKQTVGELLKESSAEEQKRKPIKVLDPACGSGSFLLGAYQFLLDWHLQQYTANEPEKWAKGSNPAITPSGPTGHLPQIPRSSAEFGGRASHGSGEGQGGGWRLTTEEKKRILLAHIHGVDIDAQAVEVTKLSLLLKVLEGASGQLRLGLERVLPDLSQNIQCGNSLIGPDYYETRQMPMFGDDEFYRVNVFDWQRAFPQIFKAPSGAGAPPPPNTDWGSSVFGGGQGGGGFDAVIGNPPYIRIQALQEWAPTEVEFYKQKYVAASKGNYDIYVVFVEKALSLLNASGKLGYILPHKFFNAHYGEPLRGVISRGKHLSKVVHFGDQQIFENASTYTCLMFLEKMGQEEFEFEKVTDLKTWQNGAKGSLGELSAVKTTAPEWNFAIGEGVGLFEKFSKMPVKLGDVAQRIFQGFKTGADPVFILEERENGLYYSNALKSEFSIEKIYLRPLYKSGEMKRYLLHRNSRFVIFPYRDGSLIDWAEISSKAPNTAEYLKSCKNLLAQRENGRWAGSQWYCYSRNQALKIVSSPKILTADLNPFANYCYDATGEACFPGGAAGGYGIVLDPSMYLYILGLLNSKAVDYFHKNISTNFRGGWIGYDAKIIRNIPIRIINFSDPAEKAAHDRLVGLVENMLALHKQFPRTPQEKEMLVRQIQSTDAAIDALVYGLYGLTEEEIKVVEGK